ncbi:MAG: GNAT family N-acetyltransferase [Ktedonobacterales bacterium]
MTGDEMVPTTQGTLTIHQATAADVDAAVAIEESAALWVRDRGYDPGLPPMPFRALFAGVIARGRLYLALLDGMPAGKIALSMNDPVVWPEADADALYVHGLMVHRDFAGKQVGRAMLDWAERRARAARKRFVRLDCMAENPELRAYYERAGFVARGELALPHRTAARYEKPVASEEET